MAAPLDQELILIAHSVRSLHNVGSMFRTADGAGVRKLYLTGYSGFPPRPEISKTALGAEDALDWEQSWEIEPVLENLRQDGWKIVAVERETGSIPYTALPPWPRVALVMGNEVSGLEPEVLEYADALVHVPMYGMKQSLNVSVCAGVVLYGLRQLAAL
ncbi:MAG: TrmH family RNA methyltransferase [Candidatus Sericytochromatia bacterium]